MIAGALCSLLLAIPAFGFVEVEKVLPPGLLAFEHAHKNAKFKGHGNVFNNKAYKEIRAKSLAEEEARNKKIK